MSGNGTEKSQTERVHGRCQDVGQVPGTRPATGLGSALHWLGQGWGRPRGHGEGLMGARKPSLRGRKELLRAPPRPSKGGRLACTGGRHPSLPWSVGGELRAESAAFWSPGPGAGRAGWRRCTRCGLRIYRGLVGAFGLGFSRAGSEPTTLAESEARASESGSVHSSK